MPLPSDSSSTLSVFDGLGLVILAAGRSTRMGAPKALVEFNGRGLLEHILSPPWLHDLGDVVVVLGHHADALRPIVDRCGHRHVLNSDPDRGRMSSVQTGLGALGPDVRAVFLQPVDCPLVVPGVYRRLAGCLDGADVAVPTYGGRGGHPALFSARLFPRVMAAGADEPLRDIFRAPDVARCTMEVDDPGVLLNIDCPEDLAGLSELYPTWRERLGETQFVQ